MDKTNIRKIYSPDKNTIFDKYIKNCYILGIHVSFSYVIIWIEITLEKVDYR